MKKITTYPTLSRSIIDLRIVLTASVLIMTLVFCNKQTFGLTSPGDFDSRANSDWHLRATWIKGCTGTVAFNNGSTAVTGIGTLFTTELSVGDSLMLQASTGTIRGKVASIGTNTSLTLAANATATAPTAAYGKCATPTSADGVITVLGHTITVKANVTVDQVVLNTGSSLTINSGVTLTVTNGTGTDFTETNSTVTVSGILLINSSALLTGGGGSNATSGALNIASGGTLTVNGTINGTGTASWVLTVNSGGLMTVTGTGIVSINRTSSGTAIQIDGNAYLTAGGTLAATGTAILTVASSGNPGTLEIEPTAFVSGNIFTLASGGTLKIRSTAGITTSGATGNIQTSTRNYNIAANYVYNGSSAQVTGNGLPATVASLTSSNPAGVTLTAAITSVTGSLTISSGAILDVSASNFGITMTSCNWINNGGTFNPRTGLVTMSNACALSGSTTFYDLTFNGSNTKDMGTGTTTIGGTLNITGGTMDGNTGTVIFTGSAGVMAGGNAKNFFNLQINSGASITTSGNGNIFVDGSYTNNGTFVQANVRNFNFTGTGAQSMSGSGSSTFGNFLIPNTGTTVNAGSHNFSITGATLTATSGAIFNGQTNTVTFAGGSTATEISNGNGTFNFNSITINSGSTFSDNSNGKNFSVSGTWTNNGTYSTGGEKITFNGSSVQTIGGSSASTFSLLTINNGAGITLTQNETVTTTLDFSNGKITTGSNVLSLSSGASVTSAGAGKYVFGNLLWNIPTGSPSRTFNIGDATRYTPVTIALASVTTGGTLTAKTTGSEHSNISTSTINSARDVNRYWTLTNSGIVFATYSATFTFINPGDLDAGASTSDFSVQRYNGSIWSTITTGTLTSVTTQATGITSFSDFAVGEACSNLDRSAGTNQSVCSSSATLGAAAAPSGATGTWSPTGGLTYTPNVNTPTAVVSGLSISAGGTLTVLTWTISQANCSRPSTVNITATTVPGAPTGSASQSFCNSATVADLTATGTSIKWYAASSGGSPLVPATALADNTHYYASQTVNTCESTSRFDVTVTINASPAAPTGSALQSFCNSASVADLIATGTSIQWYAASSGGSPLAPATTLTDNTHYYASQTVTSCESTSRFDVTVTINAPAAPTGSASQNFCNSATVADLTATGMSIQWYDAASGGSLLTPATALTDNTHYYASQTVSGCEGDSRFDVTVTINAPPAAPTGSASQSFCNSATVTDLTATGTSIQWYDAASGGSPLAPATILTDNTHYYASQTVSGCESDSRFDVTVTINAPPTAPTGSASQSFCNSATIADLTATGTSIQWYDASSGGSPLAPATALTDNTHYYASQTVGGCESDSRFDVTVTINAPAAPTGTASQSFCSDANPTVGDLTATGSNILWYAASSGGTALSNATALTDGTHYYASQTTNNCESTTRFDVTATVNTNPSSPTGTASQSFCSDANPTVGDLTATGSNILWYAASSGGTALPNATALVDGTDYFASQTTNGCESTTRFDVAVTVNTTPSAPTGTTAQSFCSAANPTVGDLTATGSNILWYASSSGGSALSNATALTDGTHYYASQTTNNCESSTRFDVTVTINSVPSNTLITSISGTLEACNTEVKQMTANSAGGPGISYLWSTGGGVVKFSDSQSGPFVVGPFPTAGNTVWVQFVSFTGSGYSVCAKAVNSCGSSVNKCGFVRGTVSVPGAITGSTVACPTNVKPYSCGLSGGASIYNWTLGGSSAPITSGQGSPNVTVTFPLGFTSGQLCVTASLACAGSSTSAARCQLISNTPIVPGPFTSGPARVCPGQTNVLFTVPASNYATGYNWTVPAGATIVETPPYTTSIHVNFPNPYTGAPPVCAYATSTCASSAGRCKTVGSYIPGQPGQMTGPINNVCNSTVQYSVPFDPLATSYTWQLPAGATNIIQNGPTIQFDMPGNFTTGYVTVFANTTQCSPGTSPARTLTVNGKPATPGTITSNPSPFCPGASVNFSIVPPNTPLPTFTWTTTNGTITGGQSTSNVDIDWTTGSGFVRVTASNSCGASGTKSQSFTSGCREEANQAVSIAIGSSEQLAVYPNPAHDKITVSIDAKEHTNFNLQLTELAGRVILSENTEAADGLNNYQMDLTHLSKGIYLLEVKSISDSWKTKVVVE